MRLWVIVLLSIFLVALGCKKQEESVSVSSDSGETPTTSTTPDFSKLTTNCFTAQNSTNAIVSSGDFFTNSHWNDPHVLYENNQFTVYASSPTDPTTNDVGIYRFTSSDGMNWTQSPAAGVLTKTAAGWSSKAVETPAVVEFNGQYHMFYTGYDVNTSTNYRIGHATSSDGITWSADTNYLLGPTGTVTDFNGSIVAEPGPVVFNNKLYVYFTALGYHSDIDDSDATPGSLVQTVGFISTVDGTNWSSPTLAFRPDQGLYPREVSGTNTHLGFSTPHAIAMNNKVYVFFDVVSEDPSWHQKAISYAYSSDGETSWTQETDTIYDMTSFAWADKEMRSPAAVLVNKTLYLWYAGHSLTPGPFTLGIGMATCDL